MSIKKTKETGNFLAETDSGKQYRIFQFQEYIDASSAGHPNDTISGLKFMRTSEGFHVNFIDSVTFKIVETNEIVRKI